MFHFILKTLEIIQETPHLNEFDSFVVGHLNRIGMLPGTRSINDCTVFPRFAFFRLILLMMGVRSIGLWVLILHSKFYFLSCRLFGFAQVIESTLKGVEYDEAKTTQRTANVIEAVRM